MLGEASLRVRQLVPDYVAVDLDDEVAFAAGDCFNLHAGVRGFDGGGQTGRRWQVVSNYAVFNRDVHGGSVGQAYARFREAIASATQPAKNKTPPIGVIGPSHFASRNTSP